MTEKRSRISPLVLAFCLFAALSQGQLTSASPAQESRTLALAIGVSRYSKLPGGQQLQFADRDAQSFVEALRKAGVPQENIRALTGQEATTAAIKSALGNWLARSASPSDTVYIFFSGHGFVEKEFGESYFLAQDSDIKDPYSTAVSITEISAALSNRVRARQVTVIADAIRRDLFPPDGEGPADANLFAQSLNRMAQSRAGASAILASGPGEFSREGQRWGGYGVFTKFLTEAIAGSADANSDGAITTGEMFDFVSKKVIEDTASRQRPWKTDSFVASAIVGRGQSVARITTPPVVSSQTKEASAKPQPARPVIESPPASAQTAKSTLPAPKNESSSSVATSTRPAVTPEPRKSETVQPTAPRRNETTASTSPRSEERAAASPPVKPNPVTPPAPRRIETVQPASERDSSAETARIEPANLPPPPRPEIRPPSTAAVSSTTSGSNPSPAATSLPTTHAGAAPSPVVLQLEAAIAAGDLIEPRNTSAWDLYQRLNQDQNASIDAARIRPRLAEALEKSGVEIIRNGALSDRITDRVDDFRRAGQMFTRARLLAPEKAGLTSLEKLSAAQALISLQFFDEAERSLTQMQGERTAAIENAMGLVYQGKFDNWRAERAFKRAIELDADWHVPHYNLGLLYRSQNNEAAIESLARAAEIAKDDVNILTTFGDECLNRQQWQRAIEVFRKAVAKEPNDEGLRTRLANALYSAGERDEANREYQKANELRKKKQ